MEVILLEKMRNLGTLGDKVKVKAGFARNFLIPKGKAVYATKDNITKFEQRRAELEKLAAQKMEEASVRQKAINDLPAITIPVKAGEEGKLFGSIGTRDIAIILQKNGLEVEKKEIRLPQGALRMLGEYEIEVDLESDLTAKIKINLISES